MGFTSSHKSGYFVWKTTLKQGVFKLARKIEDCDCKDYDDEDDEDKDDEDDDE